MYTACNPLRVRHLSWRATGISRSMTRLLFGTVTPQLRTGGVLPSRSAAAEEDEVSSLAVHCSFFHFLCFSIFPIFHYFFFFSFFHLLHFVHFFHFSFSSFVHFFHFSSVFRFFRFSHVFSFSPPRTLL